MKLSLILLLLPLFSYGAYEVGPAKIETQLEKLFLIPTDKPTKEKKLKDAVLEADNKAVPILIKVLKSPVYPEVNRWHAMFLLTRLMGDKAAPYIAQYLQHPMWTLRLAALKCLLILDKKEYEALYRKRLYDPALVVRQQALDNIVQLKIEKAGDDIWKMLFHKKNYVIDQKGKAKRTDIVAKIIRSLGDLSYEKAKDPLVRLMQKNDYQDLVQAIDYSLQKMTGVKSPQALSEKKTFWSEQLKSL